MNIETISPIAQIAAVLLVCIYAVVLFKSRMRGKILRRSALAVLVAGTGMYMYAFHLEFPVQSMTSLFFRSLVSGLKLFIYDTDLCELEKAQELPLFMDLFIMVFYSAILTSVSAIIMLFGKRVRTFFVLKFRHRKFNHIFLGINARSELIARGIENQEIAFIEFPEESDEDRLSVEQMIKHVAADEESDKWLSSRHVTILRAKHKLSQRNRSTDAFDQMGLMDLKRLVGPETAFYILSDDNERNLHDLLVMTSDPDIMNNTIHACVRREGLAKSYQSVLGKTGAHFIFPSSLSVVELMDNVQYHPIRVMNVDRDENGKALGSVSGEFNALVIGFGETGQAALKFIYEFSAAVRSDLSELPVRIYVNDSRLDGLKGQFQFSCPDMEHDNVVVYENTGLESKDFWDTLLKRLDSLNYIEISMGDDAVNMELAFTIFSFAEKKRKNGFDNFKILVRKRYTPEYEKRLLDRLNEKAGHEVMAFFGENEKIFTPAMIVSKNSTGINATATSMADKLEEKYYEVSGMQKTVATASSTYHEKRRRRRETHQFISAANHIPSKLYLSGGPEVSEEVLEKLAVTEHLRYKRYLLAHGYSYSTEDDDVLKTNHELCSWNELPELDRTYHRNVAKASLMVWS